MPRGQRFINSLKDGRNVWLQGQRIEDITVHPAFKGTLGTISRLFDSLDDPDVQLRIGFPTTSGIYAHNAFLVPTGTEDLLRRREAFSYWAEETHGVMSRLSEYARSLVTGWYADRDKFTEYDPHFADKISRYYEAARDQDLFLTTALLDPQIDRSQRPGKQSHPDAVLRIVKETEEGVVVRGAKMIATAGPYSHDFVVFPYSRLQEDEKAFAHLLIVPANLPGLHIQCRESFASDHPTSHPLSANYEEMDAVLFFDDVLVPWERVFLNGSPEGVWELRMNATANALAFHQTVVRLLAKLEFTAGVGFALAESIGVNGFLHIQEKLGELITQVESIQALLLASEYQSYRTGAGTVIPAMPPIETARNLGTRYYPRAIDILQIIGAGGFMQVPSDPEELEGALGRFMQTYFAGKSIEARDKIGLFKLAWDLIGSPLGSRHELYERYYSGDPVRNYANQYLYSDKDELSRMMNAFWQSHYEWKGDADIERAITGQPLY